MSARHFNHDHVPVHRVVRAAWDDPLDASFSQRKADRRWNTEGFPALYCCCSVAVARAVAQDVFRTAGVDLEDLQPDVRPEIAEIGWRGQVVDMVTEDGIKAAGFAPDYPSGSERTATRSSVEQWHTAGAEGVCGRSASLARRGFSSWHGDHRRFGELAIFVQNSATEPVLHNRQRDQEWLRITPTGG